MLILHVNVDPRRAESFRKHSKEIIARNRWDEDTIQIVEEPYRDLYKCVSGILQKLRKRYPDVYFQVYVGALRTHFPYSVLHMATDRFLRDAMMEVDDVALNVKQIDLDSLPLPPGFKVTFEHADHVPDELVHGSQA